MRPEAFSEGASGRFAVGVSAPPVYDSLKIERASQQLEATPFPQYHRGMATTHALTIEPDQKQLLEQLAASQLRSPEILLREAVEEYLGKKQNLEVLATFAGHAAAWDAYDGPVLTREQPLTGAEEAEREYRRTGLHLRHDEVDAWLGKLEAGEDAELPECHT